MSERDELARALWGHDMASDTTAEWREMAWNDMSDGEDYERAEYEMRAAAILGAGYRKPHVITTREELDAMPDGSVIKDRFNSGFNMHPLHRGDTEFADAILPATVLWEPR